MPTTLATSVVEALIDLVTSKIDAGAGPGTMKVYTGSKPATVEDAATGTLLATFTFADPSADPAAPFFGAFSYATWDTSPVLSATPVANGTAGWFRIADSNGNRVADGTVGTSGADLVIATLAWTTSDTIELSSGFTIESSAGGSL